MEEVNKSPGQLPLIEAQDFLSSGECCTRGTKCRKKGKKVRPRRRGYRRLFKKPLKGFRYRTKKFTAPQNPQRQQKDCCVVHIEGVDQIKFSSNVEDSSPFFGFDEPPQSDLNSDVRGGSFLGFEELELTNINVGKDLSWQWFCKSSPKLYLLNTCFVSLGQWFSKTSNAEVDNFARPLRVLSLFDGIGTGLYALQRLGLQVEAYFSSEIDDDARKVLHRNFKGQIIELGSVTSLSESVLHSLGRIDLIIGGSPCADLSLANPNRRGFQGTASSAPLFFHFARVLRWFQAAAKAQNATVLYLFENTSAMEKRNKRIISKTLKCEPVLHCSSFFVPMMKKRLFWGNLPGLRDKSYTKLNGSGHLQDYLNPDRTAAVAIMPTMTTSISSQRWGKDKKLPVLLDNGQGSYLLMIEMERLFGFHDDFTNCEGFTDTRRRRLLGRAWCVAVIIQLFKPLRLIDLLESHLSLRCH